MQGVSSADMKHNDRHGATAAEKLARFACDLRLDRVPQDIPPLAAAILKDAAGCALFGTRFPWAQAVAEHLRDLGGRPQVPIEGFRGLALPLPQAGLLLGTMCHAYELDSLRSPGAGVHPGATVALPALAHALADPSLTADRVIVAIIAGCEIMYRIGAATMHSPETRGFHAPGLTGAFGAATVSAVLTGMNADQLARAFGIAGSLGGGLLAFAKAGDGGMVKRLHLGRAAEAGMTAAALSRRGFEGPLTVLEGRFGLLDAYCEHSDPSLLTRDLGEKWEIRQTCFKRYAAHITVHGPAEALRETVGQHGLKPRDIAGISLEMSDKVLSHHNIPQPDDIMSAQYSVPFMTAAALHVDLDDPRSVTEELLHDPHIRKCSETIDICGNGEKKGWGFKLKLALRDGNIIERSGHGFSGADIKEAAPDWLDSKFELMTADIPEKHVWEEKLIDISSFIDTARSP